MAASRWQSIERCGSIAALYPLPATFGTHSAGNFHVAYNKRELHKLPLALLIRDTFASTHVDGRSILVMSSSWESSRPGGRTCTYDPISIRSSPSLGVASGVAPTRAPEVNVTTCAASFPLVKPHVSPSAFHVSFSWWSYHSVGLPHVAITCSEG